VLSYSILVTRLIVSIAGRHFNLTVDGSPLQYYQSRHERSLIRLRRDNPGTLLFLFQRLEAETPEAYLAHITEHLSLNGVRRALIGLILGWSYNDLHGSLSVPTPQDVNI
jgi:hypothetical protein